jgi:beta-glucosidase
MLWTRSFIVFAASVPLLRAAPAPADIEQKITVLMARMTLDEKIGQMSQSTDVKSPMSTQIADEIRKGRWGSFLNAGSPADRVEAQRIAMKESRLGIPLLLARDVIHGYRTIFPIPLGQSASWDPDLISQAAHVAAEEAYTEGIRWTFAPMVDITRDPRWGRVAEGLGEDPYLSSILAAAMVRGFQGSSLGAVDTIAACAKHYVGYGAAEAGREYNSTWIPEIQLRNVYLPPFYAALKAGVATFMTGFNALNGVPVSGNQFTLREILRQEWGFNGLVVSDYTAIPEMIEHGYAADPADAARKALTAGVDMEMVSTTYFDHLKSLVSAGQIDPRYIDDAVRRILRLKFQLGLFDQSLTAKSTPAPEAAKRDIAKRLATESMILLKNDGSVLPLSKSIGKIAVIGPLADSPADQMGTWVMDGRNEDVDTPLAALRRELGNDRILFAAGLKNSRDMSRNGFADALAKAAQANSVVLFLGEEQILSGEAHSRAFLDLPGAQQDLVEEVAKAGKPVIAVILAGRPMTFHTAAVKLQAILYAWHPGTMGGSAIADLLFGDAIPSGKVTMTFPRTVGQVPIYYAHLNTGRPASQQELGIPLGNPVNPVGYTSKYVDVDFTPEYPFGYGLSYTNFEYSKLQVSEPALRPGGRVSVSAEVGDTGSHEGDEVVQLYIHQDSASVARPVRELKGFRRIHLKPGERRTVKFDLAPEDLAFYDEHEKLVTEPGTIHVWIAPDSVRGVEGAFALQTSTRLPPR